jgi:hypothetical protein
MEVYNCSMSFTLLLVLIHVHYKFIILITWTLHKNNCFLRKEDFVNCKNITERTIDSNLLIVYDIGILRALKDSMKCGKQYSFYWPQDHDAKKYISDDVNSINFTIKRP